MSAQAEAGALFNPNRPADGRNFGDIYTDHANQAQLDQILLTATRPVDPDAKGYDFGFDFQLLYGADMRGNHYLGQFDRLITGRYQLGVIQADLLAHLPWLTSDGVDVKAGEFPSIMGLETLDPSTTPFYSHSLIYNWGVSFFNTGILTTTHLDRTVDLYLGVDSGNTTTLGGGDNNDAPAGYFGIGLNNLFHDKVTVLATLHAGPEQALRADPKANGEMRYYGDILTTWHVTDKLTSNTELDFIKDDAVRAEGYGFAQYLSYPLTKTLTANLRGEVFRDNAGYFVSTFLDNLGFVKATAGYDTPIESAAPTTYGDLTLGVSYRPEMPKPVKLFMIRPEIRYERSLSGTTPFDQERHNDSVTFGGDMVLGF